METAINSESDDSELSFGIAYVETSPCDSYPQNKEPSYIWSRILDS